MVENLKMAQEVVVRNNNRMVVTMYNGFDVESKVSETFVDFVKEVCLANGVTFTRK